jgi:diacylglycerol kinase
MQDEDPIPRQTWGSKFRHAFNGVKLGVQGQSSFFVHFFMASAVVLAAVALDATLVDWCLLVLCITLVLSAEMFNSALEWLAKAVDTEHNPHLGGALDIGSAAVLLAAIGAVVVGCIVFIHRLGSQIGWWGA